VDFQEDKYSASHGFVSAHVDNQREEGLERNLGSHLNYVSTSSG